MASDVEIIKEKLPIEEVVGAYFALTPSGKYLKARCPFHNERTASFVVSPERGTFYCFGCQAKGDIFEFVSRFEGLDFFGSLKILADRAGVALRQGKEASASSREQIFAVLRESAILYHKRLWSQEGNDPLQYLKSRGLEDSTIKEWGLGYAPREWRFLRDHLRQKGYNDKIIERAGLTIAPSGNERKSPFDRFRSRITFPLFDSAGRIVGFSGRIFPHDEGVAKYVNSPEADVYSKSKYLYGLHKAKQEMRKQGYCVAVEGQMDLLMSHQALVSNTIAVSGTALTEEHVAIIRRFCDTLVFALDQDAAGLGAMEKGASLALRNEMKVKVARIGAGKDPAELIAVNQDAWRRAVAEAKNVVDYLTDVLVLETADPQERARSVRKRVFPLIAQIPSSMERAAYISSISDAVGIPQSSIRSDLESYMRSNLSDSPTHVKEAVHTPKPVPGLIERAIGIMLWQTQSPAPRVDLADFRKKLALLITSERLTLLETRMSADSASHIFEAEYHYGSKKNIASALDELLESIESEIIRGRMSEVLEVIRTLEREGKKDEAERMLMTHKDLSDRLKAIPKRSKI